MSRKLGSVDFHGLQALVTSGQVDDVIQTCLTKKGGLLVFGNASSDSQFYDGELQVCTGLPPL